MLVSSVHFASMQPVRRTFVAAAFLPLRTLLSSIRLCTVCSLHPRRYASSYLPASVSGYAHPQPSKSAPATPQTTNPSNMTFPHKYDGDQKLISTVSAGTASRICRASASMMRSRSNGASSLCDFDAEACRATMPGLLFSVMDSLHEPSGILLLKSTASIDWGNRTKAQYRQSSTIRCRKK